MDIPAFLRSKHGLGISQGKLYRRLRAFVEAQTEAQSAPVKKDCFAEGFRVEEDARGQFCYSVYAPARFRRFALEKAGWVRPSEEEVRTLLTAARQHARLLQGEDPEWGLVPRAEAERFEEERQARRGGHSLLGALVEAASETLSPRERLAKRLAAITARCMPPEE